MTAIVLDKCYLQAASWEAVCKLAEANDLIFTGSLLCELLSGDQKVRRKAFAKLPRVENPVRLIENISSILSHEIETHTPAGDILRYALDFRFKFNDSLLRAGDELPHEARLAVEEYGAQICRFIEFYVERTNSVVHMFSRVTVGSDKNRLIALSEIETEICDPENIIKFYHALDDRALPPSRLITADWATFRFYQTLLLFSLHTVHRHRGAVPLPLSVAEINRIEHDVHDQIGLCLGVLAGGLATNEKKLKKWFKMLCPHGKLISL